MWTLLGLRMTCFRPMALAICFLNGSSALNARSARSAPAVNATRLAAPAPADRAEASAARGRNGNGNCQAASATAPPSSEWRRKSLREVGAMDVMDFDER